MEMEQAMIAEVTTPDASTRETAAKARSVYTGRASFKASSRRTLNFGERTSACSMDEGPIGRTDGAK